MCRSFAPLGQATLLYGSEQVTGKRQRMVSLKDTQRELSMWRSANRMQPLQLTQEEIAQLLAVRSILPVAPDLVDVQLQNDPAYFHVVLTHHEYKVLLLTGEIAFNEAGYPMYTGQRRLRGKASWETDHES